MAEIAKVKSKWRRLLNLEVVFAVGLLVAVAGIFYFSRDYPSLPGQFTGSPAFWPRLVGLIMVVMAVFILLAGFTNPMRVTWGGRTGITKVLTAIVVFYGSRWSLELFGFVPSTAILMFLCMLILGGKDARSPKAAVGMAGASAGTSFFLYLLLGRIAGIPLPTGTLF